MIALSPLTMAAASSARAGYTGGDLLDDTVNGDRAPRIAASGCGIGADSFAFAGMGAAGPRPSTRTRLRPPSPASTSATWPMPVSSMPGRRHRHHRLHRRRVNCACCTPGGIEQRVHRTDLDTPRTSPLLVLVIDRPLRPRLQGSNRHPHLDHSLYPRRKPGAVGLPMQARSSRLASIATARAAPRPQRPRDG